MRPGSRTKVWVSLVLTQAQKALGSKPMQGLPVTFEIFHVVGVIVNLSFLEKAVELKPIKTQYLARLIVRERTCPIPLDDKRLKGLASRIRVRRKIIRKMYRNFHS